MKDRISKNIKRMIKQHSQGLSFYAEFLQFVNIQKNNALPTIGVRIHNSRMELLYNEEFVKTLSEEELTYILVHESLHLILNHPGRSGHLQEYIANIAQDMVINDIIDDSIDGQKISIAGKPEHRLTLPEQYNGKKTFTAVYDYLLEQSKNNPSNDKGNGQPEGDGENKQGKGGGQSDNNEQGKQENENGNGNGNEDGGTDNQGESGQAKRNTWGKQKLLDDHIESEASKELAEEIVKETMQTLSNMGYQPGNRVMEEMHELRKNNIAFNEIRQLARRIKASLHHIRRTYAHPSPIKKAKGRQREGMVINVLLDTSGSMSNMFAPFLSAVFFDDMIINLIECDTRVTHHQTITKKKELKQLKIKGLGGTDMQPGLDFISEHGELRKHLTLLLTDGYLDKIDISHISCGIITMSDFTIIGKPKFIKKLMI